jgi:hypothetical protein
MRVAQLTIEEQDTIRDLRDQQKRYREAGTRLGDLVRAIARKCFGIPIRPLYDDKITVDQDGKYIILE